MLKWTSMCVRGPSASRGWKERKCRRPFVQQSHLLHQLICTIVPRYILRWTTQHGIYKAHSLSTVYMQIDLQTDRHDRNC